MINLKLRGTIIRDLEEVEKMYKSLPHIVGVLRLEYFNVTITDWEETIKELPFEQYNNYIYISDKLTVTLLLG